MANRTNVKVSEREMNVTVAYVGAILTAVDNRYGWLNVRAAYLAVV